MASRSLRSALPIGSLLVCAALCAQPAPPPGAAPPNGPPPGFAPPGAPVSYSAAVLVKDGVYRANPALASALSGGRIDNASARGVTIRSAADQVNGLVANGSSAFTLADSRIELAGKGASDFDGIAAGALARDKAKLVLKNVTITTRGVVSSAVTATDETTLEVRGSTLTAFGGPLPSGYVRRIGPGMMEPPTPLGIVGTARTTLTMGAAKAYYYDSTISADGWGALSTDAAHGAYLEANRCTIRVRRSGYGTYADNGATVVINDSTIDAATFGGVIAGQAKLTLRRVQGRSDGNAVMIHSVMGSPAEWATLTLEGGRFESTNAAILVKSANAEITVDGTVLNAKNGDLLLGVVNDDTNRTAVKGRPVSGIRATLRNTALQGNILQLDGERPMEVKFEATTLKGVIRDATIWLDEHSRWIATADSKVALEAPFDLRRVDAPAGVTINARAVDGAVAAGRHPLPGGGVLDVR